VAAAVIPATPSGDDEREAARRGKAEMTTPSPRFEMVEAARSRRKEEDDRTTQFFDLEARWRL
jgi:hypothetical protein